MCRGESATENGEGVEGKEDVCKGRINHTMPAGSTRRQEGRSCTPVQTMFGPVPKS